MLQLTDNTLLNDKKKKLKDLQEVAQEIDKANNYVSQSLRQIKKKQNEIETLYKQLAIKSDDVSNSYILIKKQNEQATENFNRATANLDSMLRELEEKQNFQLKNINNQYTLMTLELSSKLERLNALVDQSHIQSLEAKISDIDKLHAKIFYDNNHIGNSLHEIDMKYKELFNSSNPNEQDSKIQQIDNFYNKVFGIPELQITSLNQQLNEQLDKFQIVEKEAKNILSLSSDAGLAGGFALKVKEAKSGKRNSLFIFLILLTIIVTLNISLFNINDFTEIKWENLLFKLTLNAPFIWLATVANINLNRYSRLEQEYSHKESLARSFERYRLAIKDLHAISERESAELQLNLMNVCLDAFRINPAESSDKAKADIDILDFIKTQFKSTKKSS